MLKRILDLFKLPSHYEVQRRAEERYLAKSADLVDLERRQRELVYKENSARYV
jgi:hypothetical protein